MVSFYFKRNTEFKKIIIKNLKSSIYHEHWHIRNPGIFVISWIFRTLEYSKVQRFLDPFQTYFNIFWIKAITIFAKRSFSDHFRCLTKF